MTGEPAHVRWSQLDRSSARHDLSISQEKASMLTNLILWYSELKLLDRLAVSAFLGLILTAAVVLTPRIAGLFGG